ncbi:hypothetical protein [Halorhabdus salina]|uniref:hypothetical protein n=1 Tax=Halorhabdus salina TaxID=2750670 RepID=UPI0015EF8ACB|nr:hypothetical protein [Halorhabdus salina]
MRGRRVFVAIVLVAMTVSVVAPAALAMAPADTSTSSPTLDDLQVRPQHPSNAPAAVRILPGQSGQIQLEYEPANPLKSGFQPIQHGSTLNTNEMQVYSVRFGELQNAEDATLVIAYYNVEERTRQTQNGTITETVATDVEVQREAISLQQGYEAQTVSLHPHYDESKRVAAWLELGGERIDGVSWGFQHRSTPSTQSVQISSLGDAWWFSAKNVLGPGAIGILLGLFGARRTLKRTGTGPRIGWPLWAGLVVLSSILLVSGWFFETAVILANLPMLMGGLLGLLAYAAGLVTHRDVMTIAFERDEVSEARTLRDPDREEPLEDDSILPGTGLDAFKEILYEDQIQVPAIRNEDSDLLLPKRGIRPFLARLFADPARLSDKQIRTRKKVDKGPIDEKIYVDPEYDETLVHIPARLTWDPPLRRESGHEGWLGSLASINWSFVMAIPVLIAAGYFGLDAWLGLGSLGVVVGLVPIVVWSISTEDGYADFEPAPLHMVDAKGTITQWQRELQDARYVEQLEDEVASERARTAKEARDHQTRIDQTVTEELLEETEGLDVDDVARTDEEVPADD